MNPPILEMMLKCENAISKRCECRCGGRAHGLRRSGDESFFRALPKTDPHYLPSDEECAEMERENESHQRQLIEDLRKRNPGLC